MILFFLLLSLSFAYGESPDRCAHDCRLEVVAEKVEPVCQCSPKKDWGVANEVFFRSRMKGATGSEMESARKNLCRKAQAPPELEKIFPLKTRPLCECVSVRTHFALEKKCQKTRTGSTDCRLSHAGKAAAKARRAPTLFDYQSCIADRMNYAKPASCKEVTCEKAKPLCKEEESLFNIADPESCCPVFVCRGKSD